MGKRGHCWHLPQLPAPLRIHSLLQFEPFLGGRRGRMGENSLHFLWESALSGPGDWWSGLALVGRHLSGLFCEALLSPVSCILLARAGASLFWGDPPQPIYVQQAAPSVGPSLQKTVQLWRPTYPLSLSDEASDGLEPMLCRYGDSLARLPLVGGKHSLTPALTIPVGAANPNTQPCAGAPPEHLISIHFCSGLPGQGEHLIFHPSPCKISQAWVRPQSSEAPTFQSSGLGIRRWYLYPYLWRLSEATKKSSRFILNPWSPEGSRNRISWQVIKWAHGKYHSHDSFGILTSSYGTSSVETHAGIVSF